MTVWQPVCTHRYILCIATQAVQQISSQCNEQRWVPTAHVQACIYYPGVWAQSSILVSYGLIGTRYHVMSYPRTRDWNIWKAAPLQLFYWYTQDWSAQSLWIVLIRYCSPYVYILPTWCPASGELSWNMKRDLHCQISNWLSFVW